jgi:hypothetical protein
VSNANRVAHQHADLYAHCDGDHDRNAYLLSDADHNAYCHTVIHSATYGNILSDSASG